MSEVQQQEVERNYESFKERLPALMKTDANRFALMRDGKIIACFDTNRDALEASRALFAGEPFSIQEITDRPVDLGYFFRAGFFRSV